MYLLRNYVSFIFVTPENTSEDSAKLFSINFVIKIRDLMDLNQLFNIKGAVNVHHDKANET